MVLVYKVYMRAGRSSIINISLVSQSAQLNKDLALGASLFCPSNPGLSAAPNTSPIDTRSTPKQGPIKPRRNLDRALCGPYWGLGGVLL